MRDLAFGLCVNMRELLEKTLLFKSHFVAIGVLVCFAKQAGSCDTLAVTHQHPIEIYDGGAILFRAADAALLLGQRIQGELTLLNEVHMFLGRCASGGGEAEECESRILGCRC
jgi:hypothetical protein